MCSVRIRLVGAPVAIVGTKDDPELAADPLRNNDFDYKSDDQGKGCPLAAHTRKGNPRSDLDTVPLAGPLETHRIIRRGIPFGPEVTPEEQAAGTTQQSR